MIEEVTKEYLDGLITLSCDLSPLHEFRTEAKEEGIPIITKDVERLISILLKSSNSKRLFEVGSAVGYSACVFAQNMGKDSYVKTVERDEIRYIQAKNNIKKYGYEDNIDLFMDDAGELLKNEKESYDVVFLDGNKGHYIHMLDDCKRILKSGGLLICDNVLFRGMIDKSKPLVRRKITIVKRLRTFLEAISKDEELITSVLPIGDGLSVSIKK
ncbi:O-methyltransferase [Anaerofustis sp.]|uniref:O-methyltransferase n=1 Tax=Anaerofustis sp. TaxID=1872517 RepID=UPI0025C09D97|nr:O-methyltransferase [Anaerofustis sp.]